MASNHEPTPRGTHLNVAHQPAVKLTPTRPPCIDMLVLAHALPMRQVSRECLTKRTPLGPCPPIPLLVGSPVPTHRCDRCDENVCVGDASKSSHQVRAQPTYTPLRSYPYRQSIPTSYKSPHPILRLLTSHPISIPTPTLSASHPAPSLAISIPSCAISSHLHPILRHL